MTDIRTLLSEAQQRLALAGVEGPLRDARLLLQVAADIPVAMQIAYPERTVDEAAIALFDEFIARRADRQPIAHILGKREFWSLDFVVTPDTLVPRPDSETLVQAVLDRIENRKAPLRLLDFGTGTGCLLLALLHELPNATGLGIDISPRALDVAIENAVNLGLRDRAQFRLRNWDRALVPFFDVVISNPPYIPTEAIQTLQPEVSLFEPPIALDGGPDGLDAYRHLADAAARLVKVGGLVAFEVGLGQTDSVIEIGHAARLLHIATVDDLAGVPRCVLFKK
ncbi:MAG TPA: peptide chain release factor N(5)-glutamine methyltransferase [Dongiaceae bacterium]|nr:peptide chain release factor N(5)-glutamine methyltransferase [Dongiaceae bacterium]